ncbi:MAG: serine hydrolase [Brumimicrobium sp.]|nr:serine hydrolase [Brumimicrobium sp.]MCO5269846.1 serine hydrolase [Brumimicrobium sp.]
MWLKYVRFLPILLGFFFLDCDRYLYAQMDTPADYRSSIFYRGMSPQTYNAKLIEYRKKGYRPIDIKIFGGNDLSYTIVMRENTEKYDWTVHTQLLDKDFKTKWTEMRDKGYRPSKQRSYTYKGKQYYGAIWVKDNKRWTSYRNLTADRFEKSYKENIERGYILVDMDAYIINGIVYYSGVYVRRESNIKSIYSVALRAQDFAAHLEARKKDGYRLQECNSYSIKNQQYYACLWVRDGIKNWLESRNMTGDDFLNKRVLLRDKGYRLEKVDIYPTSSGTRYLGIWVQNDLSLIHFRSQQEIEKLVLQYMEKKPTQGMSVAIARDGKIVYQRGFGYADKELNKVTHSRTVYRLASISKAMTGTLSFMLHEKKYFPIQDTILTMLDLPAHHRYSFEELLNCQSHVRHYVTNDTVYKLRNVTAWQATKAFMNDPLVPGSGFYYSTHGYTIAAAAIEKLTGKSIDKQLRDLISNPYGFPTLNCQKPNSKVDERSALYTYKSADKTFKKATPDDITWKFGGGGMEASVYDLTRFGIAMLNHRFLTPDCMEEMLTPPNGTSYAQGWDTGTSDYGKWFGKSGDQLGARSYIRMYSNRNTVIVILCNTQTSKIEGDREKLTASIADLLFK